MQKAGLLILKRMLCSIRRLTMFLMLLPMIFREQHCQAGGLQGNETFLIKQMFIY